MQRRRRFVSVLAVVAIVGSACQPATPPASPPAQSSDAASASGQSASPPTSIAADPSGRANAPSSLAQPASAAAQTTSPGQAASQTAPTAPKATPTAPPFVATSTLAKLPPEQSRTVLAARSALAGGDYARVASLLEPLVNSLSGDQQLEVRLMDGQAQVGNRDFPRAMATAQAILDATTRADLVSAARFLKGQALRGMERWDDAATEMRAVADSNPLVAPAVRLELEDMWLGANQPDQAAADGQKGLDAAQARLLKIDLAEKLGTAEVALKQTDAAVDAYRQLLTAAGSKGYLGEQLYNLAVGASQLGHTDDAITALRTSIQQFPRSRKAPEAVELLEQLGGMRDEDRFYAGVIRYLFWNFKGARADFDAYLQALPDGDRAIEARYYKGLSSPAKDTTSQLLQLAADEPDDDFAPMALLEAGKAQEELSDYASAEQILTQLVATYPTRDAGLAGAFRMGLARYMQGNLSGALSAWTDLLGRDPSSDVRSETLYWSGKAFAASGDEDAAKAKYSAAAAVRPVDYYVMRAQVALNPPPSSSAFDPTAVSQADEAELSTWFASHGLDLNAAAQTASQDPAFCAHSRWSNMVCTKKRTGNTRSFSPPTWTNPTASTGSRSASPRWACPTPR